jgi:hypothetical protein
VPPQRAARQSPVALCSDEDGLVLGVFVVRHRRRRRMSDSDDESVAHGAMARGAKRLP